MILILSWISKMSVSNIFIHPSIFSLLLSYCVANYCPLQVSSCLIQLTYLDDILKFGIVDTKLCGNNLKPFLWLRYLGKLITLVGTYFVC